MVLIWAFSLHFFAVNKTKNMRRANSSSVQNKQNELASDCRKLYKHYLLIELAMAFLQSTASLQYQQVLLAIQEMFHFQGIFLFSVGRSKGIRNDVARGS